MPKPIDLNLLRTFTAVAEYRGISNASQTLLIPKSTVSRHISKLEEQMKAVLFTRGTEGMSLTAEGRRLFEKARPAVHALSGQAFESSRIPAINPVRIHSPLVYANSILSEAIARLLECKPEYAIEVTEDDRFSNPDPAEFDLVLYVGQAPDKNCEIWPLPPVEARLFAAPALFRDNAAPTTIEELSSWSLLTAKTAIRGDPTLKLSNGAQWEKASFGNVRLYADDPQLLLRSALRGLGIARLPTFIAETFVARGELTAILPNYVADRHTVTLARSFRNAHVEAQSLAYMLAELITHASADTFSSAVTSELGA